MRYPLPLVLAAAASSCFTTEPLAAQSRRPNLVTLGVGVTPDFEGADEFRLVPFGLADLGVGPVRLELRGLRARVDLVADDRLLIGPVANVRLPRENAPGAVGLLPEIDTAVEVGGSIGYRFSGDAAGAGAVDLEFTILRDVSDAHDGVIATASATFAAVRRRDLFLNLDAGVSWANARFARTYFGVTETEAVMSGLPTYRPGSGLRDVSLSATVGYWFGPRWGVVARAGAGYYVGDPADSPIVDQGRRMQPSAAIGLAYRF